MFRSNCKIFSTVLITSILSLNIMSCLSSNSASSFSGRQIRSVQTVEHGTVVSIRNVELKDDDPAIAGTIAGGVLGGIAGSAFGGGTGRILSTAVGAGAGALAGNVAQKAITTEKGFEIEVKLDNGRVISIVQAADQSYTPGERVRVLVAPDGTARVSR